MTECVFTLDYEIYGSGEGSLRDLVIDPTQRLGELFREFDVPFVVFTEAVEFAKMEEANSDRDSNNLRSQLRELHAAGHEIALHLHPWWANAQYESGRWQLDWNEINIATLKPARIDEIVSKAIQYLRDALADPTFTPHSFRSGLLAMQPTADVASVLARNGLQVDSSFFTGGRVRHLGLDYRRHQENGGYWRFDRDIRVSDPQGALLEIPIHTELVPFWKMLGRKRLKLQKSTQRSTQGTPLPHDWSDFLRFRYPRKLDFCRMTFDEMRETTEAFLLKTKSRPEARSVMVAIGHSKDFVDSDSTRRFLTFLQDRSISVTTFSRLLCHEPRLA